MAGLDLSERAIGFARLLNASDETSEINVEFICRDLIREPLNRRFDIATCVHVLEHIRPEALSEFLAAVRELINDGGKYICLVPSPNGPLDYA